VWENGISYHGKFVDGLKDGHGRLDFPIAKE